MVNTRFRNAALALVTFMAFLAVMLWADQASADSHVTVLEFTEEDFYIPRPAEATDQEGVERLLASIDVPAELIGQTCSVAGTSANGESVHLNNFGRLRSNGDVVDILGTEDTANGVRLSDRVIVLGTTVQLFNIMLPDADGIVATSVAYTVRVTCTTDDTTTTTAPTTSTTSPSSTTTTQADITSTTSTSSTSTTTPATSTTAPTDSTTTTSPPSSSTTAPDGSTSTTVPPTESTEPSTPPTLPKTGPPDVAGLAMAGIALLTLGFGLKMAGRET